MSDSNQILPGGQTGGQDPFNGFAIPPYPNATLQSYIKEFGPQQGAFSVGCAWVSRPFDNTPYTLYQAQASSWNVSKQQFDTVGCIVPLLYVSNTQTNSAIGSLFSGQANLPTFPDYPNGENGYPYFSMANPLWNFSSSVHVLQIRNTISVDFRFDYTSAPQSASGTPLYPIQLGGSGTGAFSNLSLPIGLRRPGSFFSSALSNVFPLPLPSNKANVLTTFPGFQSQSSLYSLYNPLAETSPIPTTPTFIYPVLSQPHGRFYCNVSQLGNTNIHTVTSPSSVFRGSIWSVPDSTPSTPQLYYSPAQAYASVGGSFAQSVLLTSWGLLPNDIVFFSSKLTNLIFTALVLQLQFNIIRDF